jgi:hypothetical protein
MNKLSASRIKVAQTCSWQYWAKYILKLPDKSNDGAKRGSICHLVFECLGNPRHKKHYNKILKNKNIFASEAVKKLVMRHATKEEVDDEENISLIKDMTLNGLQYDFFGKENGRPTKSISEKEFNIEIDQNGKKYAIRGFIDKLFLYKKKSLAIIRDFKSSKQIFKGKEVTNNLQDLMYCLAVKHLYPEYLKRRSEFVFLKFDLSRDMFGKTGKGLLEMSTIGEDELEGFEYELTEIQKYLDSFNLPCAKSSFAADQDYPKDGTFGGPLVCGKEGYKKRRGQFLLDAEGSKIENYICSVRKPMEYYVLLDKEGKILASTFKKDKKLLQNKKQKGQKIELRKYAGCPKWENNV